MASYNGPIGKLSRRLGVGLTEKGARVLKKRPTGPGQHGAARGSKPSVFALQLKEKQRLRAFYGLGEKQFFLLFEKASRLRGLTGDNLLILLERRLDNFIYRAGLAETRRQARQIVAHGHIQINGHRTDIPSYIVNAGETVSVRPQSRTKPLFQKRKEETTGRQTGMPAWLEQVTEDDLTWRVITHPTKHDAESETNAQAVVEFYSR